ncbi:MAG: hypothetical protein Q4C50_02225 [Eubacteriales bacterium]|nr:hypothetical protein [Eubacteriales bacterium]
MNKRTVLAACALLCVTLMTGSVNAEEEPQQEIQQETQTAGYEYVTRDLPGPVYLEASEEFAGGTGTQNDPYQIATAGQLALMEERMRLEAQGDGEKGYREAYYVLTADIELNDTADFEQWAQNGPQYNWRPIGGDGLDSFKGSFDGNGHVISGMYININNESYEKAYGLFDEIRDAVIKSVTLEKSYICVSGVETRVGGIAASVYGESLVADCTSNIVIDVYDGDAGGVCGAVAGGRSYFDDVDQEYTEDDDRRGPFSTVQNCVFGGTINQVREDSMGSIGGIAAENGGNLTNCVNRGTINFGTMSVNTGGIAGYGGGIISGCENAGTVNCVMKEGVTSAGTDVCAGGIAGKMFMSATGSGKYMSRVATVTDCKNTGSVSGTMSVGGIVGEAVNDHNDWCLRIENCVNSGTVVSYTGGNTGGIAGKLSCQGDNDHGYNLAVENCRNEADLSQGMVGGIAGLMTTWSGDVLIRDCVNTGTLCTSEDGLYSAGILAQWIYTLVDDDDTANVTIESCRNEGAVTGETGAGGILGCADCPVKKEGNKKSLLTLKDCSNSGKITVTQINGYLGGIAGSWGMAGIPSTIEGCVNSGELFIDNSHLTEEQKTEIADSVSFTLSRIAGGVIGKIGRSLYLSTDNNGNDARYVNGEDAYFVLRDCHSTGDIHINDPKEYQDKTGRIVYRNYIGGIIGNASGEEDYSVQVENCTYSGAERGMGNGDLPDVGEKK